MQIITITGNVGKDAEKRTTQGGDDVCAVSVGVRQGWGDKASTNWFRCNVWGKRAATVAEHVRKGMKVTVIGELTIGEYQGKAQFDVRVNDIDWQPSGDRAPARDSGRGGGGMQGSGFGDDLEDDVPFITDSFLAGLRAS